MVFVDTNVLVNAVVSSQSQHAASLACLDEVERQGGACAVHTMAELYCTLTRSWPVRGLDPNQAREVVQHVARSFVLVSLTQQEYLSAIEQFSARQLTGPMVYDALLMACARKCGATKIYTWNAKHFRRVAPDLAHLIVEP